MINELQERKKNQDLPREEKLRIRIRGTWNVTVYDAMTGEIYPVKAEYHKGDTILKQSMFDHDSLLLWLEPADAQNQSPKNTDSTENNSNFHDTSDTQIRWRLSAVSRM